MKPKSVWFALGSILTAAVVYFFLPESCSEAARRMAFIFVLAALFWALEIIPLFATSLLVVLLEAFLLGRPGGVLGMNRSGYTAFLIPFSNPVIMLFLGGFVLARALQKYKIDRWIAQNLLKLFGQKPYFVVLGFMVATGFLSMWLSNTATAALMLAMVHPLLSNLERDDPFKKAIVLGVAFAASIGGIATPVGTPPNAIAMGLLEERGIHLNFLSWVVMAAPLAALLILITSGIIYFFFPSKNKKFIFKISDKVIFAREGKAVMVVGFLTVFLWLGSGWLNIPEALTALLATGLLTAFQLVDRNDFKSIDWDILVLMWGGLALGEGMEASGLANWIVAQPLFSHQGFFLIIIFCFFSAILSTFMSNTATVNLLIPIALSIPGENPIMLATIIALASSFDIALPIATPPMAIAYATQEVSVRDMLKAGIVFTLIANTLLLVGFEFVMNRTLLS